MIIDRELIKCNEDIMAISSFAKKIGWKFISELSYQRILYLAKVLYTFKHINDNIFDYYHFSVTTYGPYSDLINRSLIFLQSSEMLKSDKSGGLALNTIEQFNVALAKVEWFHIVLLILGKYGEKRIFGFIINDPLYDDAVKNNSVKELDTASPENETVKVLNNFKASFESTLDDISSIKDNNYIDLYFEYIFSQIIGSNYEV